MRMPSNPKIYHITHVDNLAGILKHDGLLSDACMLKQGGPGQIIGMPTIKRRRLEELEVSCHPGTKVGQYVPFYFCPRSVMLYVIYRGNHPELAYRDGQDFIVHLELDLHKVVQWAGQNNVLWAFSLSNAGAYYAEFRARLEDLKELDWRAIFATDFRDPDIKEKKQAEFLLFGYCPWQLIERIGTRDERAAQKVHRYLRGAKWTPIVEVLPKWYY